MPRKARTEAAVTIPVVSRKPYPDRETRISMADVKIERLQKLNAERSALIEKTEAKLNERKAALKKSQEQLERVISRKAKLTAEESGASHASSRAAKAAEKAQLEEIKAKLAAKGKTLEDVLNSL